MAKRWLKVTIKTDPSLIDPISDFLVGVLDAGVETAAIDEPDYGTVNGFIQDPDPDPEEVEGIVNQVSAYLKEIENIFGVESAEISSTIIEEEDWGKSWKKHFTPFAIVPGLVIVPTWEHYDPEPGEQVITMDPGMAFGTGHHATTSLSLAFIRECLVGSGEKNKTVLDVGTGTGILGMAALLFGAQAVTATDNDPEAVEAAADNVKLNGMEKKMSVSLSPLSDLQDQFDIVVANIVHDVLASLADDLASRIVPGGNLVLSGLMGEGQVASIREIFLQRGLDLVEERVRGEWGAICFARRK